jgi:hypothetical protein
MGVFRAILTSQISHKQDIDFNEDLELCQMIFRELLKNFKKIYMINGNHDQYLFKLLNYEVNEKNLWKWVIPEEMDANQFFKKVEISEYPFCEINNKWHVTHPRSYSQIPTSVAGDLRRNICEVLSRRMATISA